MVNRFMGNNEKKTRKNDVFWCIFGEYMSIYVYVYDEPFHTVLTTLYNGCITLYNVVQRHQHIYNKY